MKRVSREAQASIFYHSLFDYPLNKEELSKWCVGERFLSFFPEKTSFIKRDGFYVLSNKGFSVSLRKRRERFSDKKIGKARKVVSFVSLVPTIKLVAITGSLAMRNARLDSDIDLMIVVKKGFLWTTRLFVYFLLFVFNFPFRKFGDKNARDKLCLNIWLDEKNLVWPEKNIFTAHEILQIVPLLNRNSTYERFLYANSWAFDYWPNAVNKRKLKRGASILEPKLYLFSCLWAPFEFLFFLLQRLYMLGKIKNETVSPDKAIFHPINLSDKILKRLRSS